MPIIGLRTCTASKYKRITHVLGNTEDGPINKLRTRNWEVHTAWKAQRDKQG
jgi:hypothetical protein